MHNSCTCCGKGLSDPVSMELGIGPVCRVTRKMEELGERTGNLFSNRSRYSYEINHDFIWIVDEGGHKSVTNDIELILVDLIEDHGRNQVLSKKIMYRDSMGIWDGIRYGENGVSFFPITEKDFDKAITKLRES